MKKEEFDIDKALDSLKTSSEIKVSDDFNNIIINKINNFRRKKRYENVRIILILFVLISINIITLFTDFQETTILTNGRDKELSCIITTFSLDY